ncbi:MAG: flagellar hook-basal body protein [Actinomycetia bacterium]|nr:flagellar hook-basal body protein [Actinomycetes bacterium]
MLSSLGAAITGLTTEQQELNVIGNNLANQSTPGFKAGELDFATLLSQTFNTGTAPNPPTQGGINPFQIGMGAQTTGVTPDQSEGPLMQTGNPLDFAIQGNGYFVLRGPNGTTYTRAGLFAVDAAGNLVDRQTGTVVQGYSNVTSAPGTSPATVSTTATAGGLQIPQLISNPPGGGTGNYELQSFSVGQDGTIVGTYQAVSAATTPATVSVTLGQLAIAQFANPDGLVAVGDSQFVAGPDSGTANVTGANTSGAGQVIEGALEGSNTNLVQSMADLVGANGAYDTSAKVITIAQQMQNALDQMVQ